MSTNPLIGYNCNPKSVKILFHLNRFGISMNLSRSQISTVCNDKLLIYSRVGLAMMVGHRRFAIYKDKLVSQAELTKYSVAN